MDWINNGSMSLAKDVKGNAIGVTLNLLVLTDDVKKLPEPWREQAHRMLYENAVNK